MSNEEFDRRMEFIIEQQAKFASDTLQLREAQAETRQIVAQTSRLWLVPAKLWLRPARLWLRPPK